MGHLPKQEEISPVLTAWQAWKEILLKQMWVHLSPRCAFLDVSSRNLLLCPACHPCQRSVCTSWISQGAQPSGCVPVAPPPARRGCKIGELCCVTWGTHWELQEASVAQCLASGTGSQHSPCFHGDCSPQSKLPGKAMWQPFFWPHFSESSVSRRPHSVGHRQCQPTFPGGELESGPVAAGTPLSTV